MFQFMQKAVLRQATIPAYAEKIEPVQMNSEYTGSVAPFWLQTLLWNWIKIVPTKRSAATDEQLLPNTGSQGAFSSCTASLLVSLLACYHCKEKIEQINRMKSIKKRIWMVLFFLWWNRIVKSKFSDVFPWVFFLLYIYTVYGQEKIAINWWSFYTYFVLYQQLDRFARHGLHTMHQGFQSMRIMSWSWVGNPAISLW